MLRARDALWLRLGHRAPHQCRRQEEDGTVRAQVSRAGARQRGHARRGGGHVSGHVRHHAGGAAPRAPGPGLRAVQRGGGWRGRGVRGARGGASGALPLRDGHPGPGDRHPGPACVLQV